MSKYRDEEFVLCTQSVASTCSVMVGERKRRKQFGQNIDS